MSKSSSLLLLGAAAIVLAGVLACGMDRESDRATVGASSARSAAVGSEDPARAVLDVFALADPVERETRFVALLNALPPDGFPVLEKALQGPGDEWSDFEVRLFIWAWSRVDPSAAMDAALHWSPALRDAAGYAAARAWARRDPLAAREAVRLELERAETPLTLSLMSGVAHGWSESGDYAGALAFIEDRFASLVHREALIDRLAAQILKTEGTAKTFAWAEDVARRHDDRAFLSIVFRKVGRNAVLIDPEATVAWLERFEGDPAYVNRARRAAAVAWGRADPEAALGWMLAQPAENDRRSSGVTAIVMQWVEFDEASALDWARKAPRDPALDAAFGSAADKVAHRSPRDALLWVERIGDPAVRESALVSVGARWWAKDAAEAARWAEDANLAASIRARMQAAGETSADEKNAPGTRAGAPSRS